MRSFPGKKALIATSNGQSTKKYGYLARVEKEMELAGVEHELFDEIRPNPTRDNVMDGAKKAKDTGCDFVVALGGGSVMDCAKCIALMMTNDGDIWDYSLSAKGGKKNAGKDAAPIVCITTSAGTGSEVDMASVISYDEVRKRPASSFIPCSRQFP
jgi:alcohol dehydrogenase